MPGTQQDAGTQTNASHTPCQNYHNKRPQPRAHKTQAPSHNGPGLSCTQKGERMSNQNKYDAYSIRETAQLWNVSDNTIRNLIDTGELYAFRVGRQLRIPASEVNRIVTTPANPICTIKEAK